MHHFNALSSKPTDTSVRVWYSAYGPDGQIARLYRNIHYTEAYLKKLFDVPTVEKVDVMERGTIVETRYNQNEFYPSFTKFLHTTGKL